jgi:hypothetical protein
VLTYLNDGCAWEVMASMKICHHQLKRRPSTARSAMSALLLARSREDTASRVDDEDHQKMAQRHDSVESSGPLCRSHMSSKRDDTYLVVLVVLRWR